MNSVEKTNEISKANILNYTQIKLKLYIFV